MTTKVYLDFGGIKSTTSDQNHKGWIEMDSFVFDLNRKFTQTTGSSNRHLTKPEFSSIKMTKKLNAATQDIFKQASGGNGVDTCTIHLVGDKGTFMEYKLHKAVITHYTIALYEGGSEPHESIEINYSRIDTRHIPSEAGSSPKNAGYDIEVGQVL